jgi:hypothetical protein
MIYTALTAGGEKEDYPPIILLPPPLLSGSNKCDDASDEASCFDMEHFHWTACQQQTQVNVACSRAQWMKDSLAVLLFNHDNRSTDDAVAYCNRDSAQQLMLPLRLWKRMHLQLRLGCGRMANELYISFCRALPLEYLRLWAYLWHLSHSYLPCKTADINKNNNAASISNRSAKKSLQRHLIMTSLFIAVVALQVRIQLSLQQQQLDISTSTPCLVCFRHDDTISLQPAVATTLPFRPLFFETVHYSGLSSPEQVDWLLS